MTAEVLILEDDPHLMRLLATYLGREGFQVRCSGTLAEAHHLLGLHPVRAAIVDVVLDRESGLDFVRHLRANRPDIGVIIASSRDSATDRIVGLEVGADDYVTKPVDLREVLVRLRRLLERLDTSASPASGGERLRFGGFVLDTLERRLCGPAGQDVALTGKEFELLRALAQNAGTAVSRDQIARMVHGRDWNSFDRAIDVMVGKVRSKLADAGGGELIKTVRSVGYQLAAEVMREARALR